MMSPVRRTGRYQQAGTFRERRCDAYYRQHDPGWHSRLGDDAPFQGGLKAYSRGGGFAGQDPGTALLEYIRGSVPPCNETLLAAVLSRGRRRPHLPSLPREGCSAFFRAFEGFGSCSPTKTDRHQRMGLSLWSPLVPLNGSCVFPLLPPADSVLRRVWWLPRKTLGIHVRRGDFDKRWPRASLEEWMHAVLLALRTYGLVHLFVSSDDPDVHGFFVEKFRERGRSDIVLPRFMEESYLPTGTRKVDRAKLWSKDGNIRSLAEQVSLGTADFILGTWGSTYSTLAAAWFDKPIAYVPVDASRECASATVEHPCRWRGATVNPAQSHRHGTKCGASLLRWVDRLRNHKVTEKSRYVAARRQLPGLIQAGRRNHGFSFENDHRAGEDPARARGMARRQEVKDRRDAMAQSKGQGPPPQQTK